MDSNLIEEVVDAIQAGRITEKDLRDVLSKKPDVKLQDTVDLIHTLFCRGHHTGSDFTMDGDEKSCSYYSDRVMVDCWNKESHIRWRRATELLLERTESTPASLQKDLRALRTMMIDTWEGKPRNPIVIALYFFLNFIGDDEKFFSLAKQFIEEIS